MSTYHLQNGLYFLENGLYSLSPPGGTARIDGFEDGSLSEYQGDTANYSVVQNSTDAYAGDYHLQGQGGGTIYSTGGLENYFGKGDSARAYVYCETAATERVWILFGLVDNRDHYAARVDWVNGAFALVKRTTASGLQTLTNDTAVAPPAGTWLAVDIDWQSDDTIVLSLVNPTDESELTSLSWSDTTFASETGVGVTVDGNGTNALRVDEYIRGDTSGSGGGSGGDSALGMITSFEGDLSGWRGQTGSFGTVDTSTLSFDARDGSRVLRSAAQGEMYSRPGTEQGDTYNDVPSDPLAGASYTTDVNAVSDLGLDDTGETPIDSALEGLSDNTRVTFPAGDYLVQEPLVTGTNIALVGAGTGETTLVHEDPESDFALHMTTGGDFRFEGFDVDITASQVGSLFFFPDAGDLVVEDVRLLGVMDRSNEGLGVAIEDPNSVGIVRDVGLRDGGTYDSASHGFFVNQAHAGALWIVDTEVGGWPDNGLYASSPGYIGDYNNTSTSDRGNGPVHVRGGRYWNNNISNLRIGSTGSSVRGTRVENLPTFHGDTVSDRDYPIMPRSGTEPSPVVNSRGIWLENRPDMVVRDCQLFHDEGISSAAIMCGSDLPAAAITSTDIETTTEDVTYALRADAPRTDLPSEALTVTDCAFSGTAGSGSPIRIESRAGTAFRDSTITFDGEKNGLLFVDTSSATVENTAISVGGTPIVTDNSSVTVTGDDPPALDEAGSPLGGGLPRYPQKGQRGEIWFRWGDTPTYEARFNLGFGDQSNNYLFRVRPSGPELEIGSEDAGEYAVVASDPIGGSLVEGAWYRLKWMWDDGRWQTDNRLSAELLTAGGSTLASCGGVNSDHAAQRGVAVRNWNGPDGDALFWDKFEITGGKS